MNSSNGTVGFSDHDLKSSRLYDFAVSLGAACIVADKMEKNNLRLFSGPFDWIVGSPERVNYLIKNNFKGFFRYENLEIEGRRDGKFLVRDKLNRLLSVHDFKGSGNKVTKSEYNQVKEKYDRRIRRLYDWCRRSEKALFVIFLESEDNLPEVYRIKETISFSFPHLCFDILVVYLCPEKISEIKRIDDHLYLARVYHDEGNWPGSDLHWKNVLSRFSIDFSHKTIDLSEVLPLKNNRLSFRDPDDMNRFVYLGLSNPEPHGRWSIGDKTRIGLKLNKKPEKMTVKCGSYRNKSSLVYVNGKCAGSLDFTTNSYSHEFDIKDIDMENRHLVIDFIHETPISPLSIGESPDSRMLAVLFDEIRFS